MRIVSWRFRRVFGGVCGTGFGCGAGFVERLVSVTIRNLSSDHSARKVQSLGPWARARRPNTGKGQVDAILK